MDNSVTRRPSFGQDPLPGASGFRSRFGASGADAADFHRRLALHLEHPQGDLDLRDLDPRVLERAEPSVISEFVACRGSREPVLTELILPEGMAGLPAWVCAIPSLRIVRAARIQGHAGVMEGLRGMPALELLDLPGAQLPHTHWVGHLGLQDGTRPRMSLRGAHLEGAHFTNIDLTAADFGDADLRTASFEAVLLRGANLQGCDAAGSSWTRVSLDGASAGTMRNTESATFENCTVPGARLPQHLGARVRADDVLRPGDSFWVVPREPFDKAMRAMCRDLQLNMREIESLDVWARDRFFGTAHSPPMIYRQPIEVEETPASTLAHNHWASHLRSPVAAAPTVHGDAPASVPGFAHPSFAPRNVGFIPASAGRFVEGGNVFVTEGRCCVIGNDELRHGLGRPAPGDQALTAQELSRIGARYTGVSTEQAVALWRARRAAKAEIKELLGADRLVVIPQIFYHIDLAMAYLGRGQFLVHSFAETLRFMRDNAASLQTELGEASYAAVMEANRRYVARGAEDRFVDKTCRRLEQAGLVPVRCCLMLLSGDISRGRWEPGTLHSMFSNGVAHEGESGERTFVTLGAPRMATHKAYMRQTCAGQGVKVAFMGDEDWPELTSAAPRGRGASPAAQARQDPVDFIDAQGGGLRCLSQRNLEAPLNFSPAASHRAS